MKKYLVSFLTFLVLLMGITAVQAQSRRPIDSQHPLWLIHIDVWNNADPQKIINLIPEDVRPYVCFNLSLSCQYDTDLDIYKMPQNAVLTYKSWASVCCANNVWFTCQPASGGHTHIQDDDLSTFEYFFKHYPNFLGWNYAEQFWGFDEANDESSSTQASRLQLFANLVPMHHKYGGVLIISFCGNIWSHGLNPIGMMKRNNQLLNACKKYPEACLWLYKYTTSSCFYNNESVTLAPFISGLATNYGVRYDNCGWNGALDALLGEGHGRKYPAASGYGTVLEQTAINGGAVWDGPELIWTEDFKELNRTNVNGYERRNWGTYTTFDNGWLDLFRKVIDGSIYIPTRKEVIGRNKVVIINNDNSGNDQNKYAMPGDLYDGLYKQNDHFNRGNGQFMDNLTYFKKTGRYQAIPVVIDLYDSLAKTIPTQVKRTAYASTWPSQARKVAQFNKLYPEISTGDLFVSRHNNSLITYYPFSYFRKATTASAEIPLLYNTCDTLGLVYGKFGNGVINEYADHIDVYLNNFRSDTTTLVTDRLIIRGATSQPTYTFKKRVAAKATTPTEAWDAETGTYTLTIQHLGPVELAIQCAGKGTDKRTDTNSNSSLSLDLPVQPADYYGDLIHEAEDMDFKSVGRVITHQYNQARNYRGHSAMGMVEMGTNSTASLRDSIYVKHPGAYTIRIRYVNTSGRNFNIITRTNGTRKSVLIYKTNANEWREATLDAELKEGGNAFIMQNTAAVNFTIDCVTYSPVDQHTTVFALDSTQVAGNDYQVTLKEGDYKFSYQTQEDSPAANVQVNVLDAEGKVVATNSSTESPTLFYFSVATDGDYTVCFSSEPAADIHIAHAEINSCYLYHVNIVDAETEGGTSSVSPIVCEAGTEVMLTATPNEGYVFSGWDVIHGNVSISEEGTFTMPERDVTVKPIFTDMTSVYELSFNGVNTGTFPKGWIALDGTDEHSYPNSYTSGARTFIGFGGYQSAALYWRNTRATYGKQSNYHLHLQPGNYKLFYAMAAWKAAPTFSAQIQQSNGTIVAESETHTATPNANGNTAANLRSAKLYELPFTITEAGNYLINFERKSGGFDEYLLLECRIHTDSSSDAIDIIANDATFHAVTTEYYSLDGQRLARPQQGVILMKQTDANGRCITQKMMIR